MTALINVKEFIGVPEEETIFDTELLSLMNQAVSYLFSLGIDELETVVFVEESEYTLTPDQTLNNYIKVYLPTKVKLEFDISANTNVQSSRQNSLGQLEQRIIYRLGELARVEG